MVTIVQTVFDDFASGRGLVKKSGSWFLRRDETILVLNLQKSNYASRYYLNVGVWLLPVATADFPKEQTCHIRTRLSELVSDAKRVDELLDVDWVSTHSGATDDLALLLETTLDRVIETTGSVVSLRTEEGRLLIQRSLVTGPGQRLLAQGES